MPRTSQRMAAGRSNWVIGTPDPHWPSCPSSRLGRGHTPLGPEFPGATCSCLLSLQGRATPYGRRDMAGQRVAVVGAGGVSRAIVAGLADVGAEVCIYNRTVEKARALAEVFACEYAGLDALASLQATLLVNGTSLGMSPNVETMPVPESVLTANMAVFDTVYNPLQTRLLKTAQAKGSAVVDGLAMFVGQAMAQFKLFTGQGGDPDLMREVVMTQLGER